MNIVKDSKGNRHIFAVVLDITDEKSSAETDALTGILNKGAFNFNVREYMKLHADEHIALFMIDLNYFKEVNDKYGHQSGDTILIKTVEYLKAAFVDEDAIIGRVGGDEFMVLVKSVISEDAVMALKKKVQDNFRLRIDDIPDFPPVSGIADKNLTEERWMDITYVSNRKKFNYRVCAIIISNNKILAMHDERSPYFYLPGGRVQMGETAEHAVVREVEEELNITPKIIRPLWLNQSFFTEDVDKLNYHEICIYYLMDISETGL